MMTTAAPTATEIKRANLQRLREQEEMARNAGLAMPPPVYALGTPINQVGHDNFRAFRTEWENRPTFGAVCDEAVARIQAENRPNLEVDLNSIWMDSNGTLSVVDRATQASKEGPFTLTKPGLDRLLFGLSVGGGLSYLMGAPSPLRAMNVNYWATHGPSKKWSLRTRNSFADDGAISGREIFACTGPKYPCLDADKLAGIARDLFPQGARGDLVYDGEKFRLGATYFTDIQPEDCCAGEVFRGWVAVSTRDDAKGSVTVRWGVERNLCLNLIILGRAEQRLKVRHSGDVNELRAAVQEALQHGADAMRAFATRWTAARQDKILEGVLDAGKWGARDLIAALVAQDFVRAPGVDAEVLTDRIYNAWQLEPGYCKSDLVNAVTRAAHTESWESPWVTEALEEQAGELLYQRVAWQNVYDVAQDEAGEAA